MKKVILINQSTGFLMIDIVNAYAKQYDEVVLLAGSVTLSERELDKKVTVKKIVAYNRKSGVTRAYTWLIGALQIFWFILIHSRQFEIVYVTNPPMSYFSSLFFSNPFSVIVYDTYPDALKNIGIGPNNLLYQWWVKTNIHLFKKAKRIITLSDGMAKNLSHYVTIDKIKVVPNWPSSEKFKPIIDKTNNPFAVEHQLTDKFVVMYSGNMGFTHSVEVLIQLAEILKDNEYIHFLFIGEGQKKKELLQSVHDNKLENCTFLTWQGAEILPFSLATADIGVISLNEETGALSVPSKTYNLLAVGCPLLCITPENSELVALVKRYQNGECFRKGQIQEMIEYIIDLSKDKERKQLLSENSLKAAKDFTYKNAEEYV